MTPFPAYRPDMKLSDLRTAEKLMIVSLRLYALDHLEPGRHPDWRPGFAAAGLPPCAAIAFQSLFDIVAVLPRRPLDVRCLHCAGLGQDESRLLQLLSLFQRDRSSEAEDVLGEWLPRSARRLAAPAAMRLAVALRRAGLVIPWRHGDMAAIAAHYIDGNPGLTLVQ